MEGKRIGRTRRKSYSLSCMRTEPVCGMQLVKIAQMSEKYDITRDYFKSKWKNSEITIYERTSPGTIRKSPQTSSRVWFFFYRSLICFCDKSFKSAWVIHKNSKSDIEKIKSCKSAWWVVIDDSLHPFFSKMAVSWTGHLLLMKKKNLNLSRVTILSGTLWLKAKRKVHVFYYACGFLSNFNTLII